MLSKVSSLAPVGLGCEIVEIEVDVSPGFPGFTIVGLPDTAIQESRERIRSALKNGGFYFPTEKRVTVNLAPADFKKQGPSFDLPIALGILLASGQIEAELPARAIFAGELSLKGTLRHINGVLPLVSAAIARDKRVFFVPEVDAEEAAIVKDATVFPVRSLQQLAEHLQKQKEISPQPDFDFAFLAQDEKYETDLAYVRGQEHAKRALTVAAAGSHNILFSGPPGSGKTMLARAFRTILPRLTLAEALDVTKVYSLADLLPSGLPLISRRPFRSVHHTASGVSIVGGGRNPTPGEISLAHKGVLFLDELAEFPTAVLELLRQPLEDGVVTISRAAGTLTFPASFTLVAAMNPCPCGFATDTERTCRCSAVEITRYQKKLSGPLLDRIDMHVEVPRVKFEKLAEVNDSEDSVTIRQKVQIARDIQKKRFEKLKITANSEMGNEQVKKFCLVDQQTEDLLKQAMNHFRLSARAYYRMLKLARTIADLIGAEKIATNHVAEALQYRPKIGE